MIKKLAAYVRQYRRPAILTPLCMIGEVFMEMLIPYIMASLINDGIQKADMGVTIRCGALMLLCALVFVGCLACIGSGVAAGAGAEILEGITT